MSPSGKAPDFDSGIRRFESCHPSHVGARRALLRFFPRLGVFSTAGWIFQGPFCAAAPTISLPEQDNPCCRPGVENVKNDPLAQLAEQLPFKQWVWSSNLQRVTTSSRTSVVRDDFLLIGSMSIVGVETKTNNCKSCRREISGTIFMYGRRGFYF